MSENEINPVAWQYKNGRRWETVSENTYQVYCTSRERRALYDQSAIDRLAAERDAAVAAVNIAYRHLDVESLRVSHCNDLSAIDAARSMERQA